MRKSRRLRSAPPPLAMCWLALAAGPSHVSAYVRPSPMHVQRPLLASSSLICSSHGHRHINGATDGSSFTWSVAALHSCSSSSSSRIASATPHSRHGRSGGLCASVSGGGDFSASPLAAWWRERRRAAAASPFRLASAPLLLLDTKLIAAVIGGLFAGGLHAVTGPDHLAALLPLCMGRRWWIALYTGAYWGLGHGIGAALVGALAFAVRGALNLDALSSYMEAAVGISIVIIGANGVREAREWGSEHEGPTEVAKQHSLEVAMNQAPQTVGIATTLGTGILHGCSGSGHLLGVMPALAMPSWSVATTYLVMFGIGTMIAMSMFTAAVGELSTQMSEKLNDPRTPGRLALASSLFALTMGSVWTARALLTLLPRRLALA